jgi:hypothetical protein
MLLCMEIGSNKLRSKMSFCCAKKYMKYSIRDKSLYIIVLCQVFLFLSCWNERDKKNYLNTLKICNQLYVEIFRVYNSGVYGGAIESNHLTDSLNFRIFVGTYDDHRIFNYECSIDSVFVRTLSRVLIEGDTVFNIKGYNLKELKSSKKFE